MSKFIWIAVLISTMCSCSEAPKAGQWTVVSSGGVHMVDHFNLATGGVLNFQSGGREYYLSGDWSVSRSVK